MKNMYTFSIIIPAYNCEKTIGNTLKSIIDQDYQNYEIIIVNDGSTDSTVELLNNFSNNKIKIINQKNSGVSIARNTGVSVATGKYVLFVDSDDYIEKGLLSTLAKNIFEDYDMLVFGYRILSNKMNKEFVMADEVVFSEGISKKVIDTLNYNVYWMSCCNKIYKREKLGNIKFNSHLVNGEDLDFNIKYLTSCDKAIKLVDIVGYVYKIEENQFKYRKNSMQNHILITEQLKSYAKKNNLIQTQEIDCYFWNAIIYDLLGIIKTKKLTFYEKISEFKILKKYNNLKSYDVPPGISLKKKNIIKVIKLNYIVTFFFMKLYSTFFIKEEKNNAS